MRMIEYRRSASMPEGIPAILVADRDHGIVLMNVLMNVKPDSRAVTMLLDEVGATVRQH